MGLPVINTKIYTCPMSPDAPGQLSPCGMALELKTETILDVNNGICPVSGELNNGKPFAVSDGKRYGFCCDMCLRKFKKNPEKYIN